MKKYAAWVLLTALCGWTSVQAAIPVYGFVVKNSYPHDTTAFTEGLVFKDGFLYESTGMKGHSNIRKVELATGKILQQKDIPAEFFGEGIAEIDGNIVALTWTTQVGFVFDMKTFKQKRQFHYTGEGWGITSHERQLYMTDGTPSIRILDPAMKEVRRIEVTADGKPLPRLNEIEWVDGELYVNVWGTDVIARIDPASGKVVGWVDLTALLPAGQRGTDNVDAVLNGIAYDSKKRRLYVTGKLWPKLFEIELVQITR
ncbi:MAG: glutaminyl-peptide cyclotransferase [Massilia sp.]